MTFTYHRETHTTKTATTHATYITCSACKELAGSVIRQVPKAWLKATTISAALYTSSDLRPVQLGTFDTVEKAGSAVIKLHRNLNH